MIYILLIIISLLIILITLNTIFYYKKYLIESYKSNKDDKSYKQNKCNDFYSKNSYCTWDVDENRCECKYQKDSVKYIIDSPSYCCKRDCSKLLEKDCISTSKDTKINYYCNYGGKCNKYHGTMTRKKIAANYCGNDPLNNQIILPFASLDECDKSLDHCDKYNIPDRSMNINKSECLKDTNCGFCTNDDNGGKCISGTASGPNDLQRYYFCKPDSKKDVNKYIYGNHVAYLLQSADIKKRSFS